MMQITLRFLKNSVTLYNVVFVTHCCLGPQRCPATHKSRDAGGEVGEEG